MAGGDVLPRPVQPVLEGASSPVPVGQHVVVAASAEQPGEVRPHALADDRAHHRVVRLLSPSAVPEAVAGIFVGPARTLQDTVKADVVDDQYTHGDSLLDTLTLSTRSV